MTASLIVDIPYFSNHLDQVKKDRYIATFANNFRPRITPYRTKQETGASPVGNDEYNQTQSLDIPGHNLPISIA
jgi:hypothetical protein